MSEPVAIKQIQSTVVNACIILFGAPVAGVGLSFINGELHTWSDFPKALDHGMFLGVGMTFAWLGMASPVGIRLRTLLSSIRTGQGEQQEMRVELQPDPSKITTTTLDPVTQKVTIKEEPTK